MKELVRLSRNRQVALEQDEAAGGAEFRKMYTKTRDVVTVSLAVDFLSSGASRVALRFKLGGHTVQRSIGKVRASSRPEALKLGWKMIRDKKIVEKEGWSWVVPSL